MDTDMDIDMENTIKDYELELGLKLPKSFCNYEPKLQEQIIKYLKQLNKIERTAYNIGIDHLGSSFNLVKSNGFNDWLKKQ